MKPANQHQATPVLPGTHVPAYILEKIPAVTLPPDKSKLPRTVAVTMKNGAVKWCGRGVDV